MLNTDSNTQGLLQRLGIDYPIIQAPMAGTSTPALAAAVSNAGGLGSLGVGAMTPAATRAAIRAVRELTPRPFNINVFTHRPPQADPVVDAEWLAYLAPRFAAFDAAPPGHLQAIYSSFVDDDEMLSVLLEERPPVVSFHFGLPSRERIEALHKAGIVLLATATSAVEAEQIEAAGIDAIVAQGIEAGGHRGVFDPSERDEGLSTHVLVSLLKQQTTLPIIAAGGVMNGAGIAAALAAGAQAVQLGTAFITTPESAADAAYRTALLSPGAGTTMTAAISGRPARCLENNFTALGRATDRPTIPAYPTAYDAGKALHAAAKARGDFSYGAQWAGQGVNLSRALSAASLMETLIAEWRAAS